MFARMTRFEGSEPAKLKQELGEMRNQMERGLSDESIDQMAEQVKGQFERDEVARLLGSIKRSIVLADAEKGSSAMVLFCETEEDVRGVDIFRFNDDGKIIEHWDVLHQISKTTASGNDMFSSSPEMADGLSKLDSRIARD